MKKLLIAVVISLLTTVAAWGQSPATGRIQVLGLPGENETLEVGRRGEPVIFEFASSDPNNDHVWIQVPGLMQCTSAFCSNTIVAAYLAPIFEQYEEQAGVTFTYVDGDTIFVETTESGYSTNTYVLFSESDAFCLGSMCGGHDQ